MIKKIALCGCFLFLFSGLNFAKEATLEFEGRFWLADLDSKVRVENSGIGSDFDFKDDLGIDDENFPEGRLSWHINDNSRLRFAYTRADFEGDQTVSRAIEFDGRTFTAGTQVVSEFDMQYARLGWIWQFINLADGKLKLGPIIEVKGFAADMSLEAPSLSIKEEEEVFAALPTIGLALDINPIEKINLFAEASGIAAGEFGHFFDAEFGIKFFPINNFSILAGYRIIDIKAENDPDFVKAKLNGPFAGATFRF